METGPSRRSSLSRGRNACSGGEFGGRRGMRSPGTGAALQDGMSFNARFPTVMSLALGFLAGPSDGFAQTCSERRGRLEVEYDAKMADEVMTGRVLDGS